MTLCVDRQIFTLPLTVERDVEVLAVGDIHGRSDLLRALLDEGRATPRRAATRKIVFLGDLIDRGPDSLGAIDLAARAGEIVGADETIALMGNHEGMMRLALDPATRRADAIDAFQTWLANGGARVIGEFVDPERTPADLDELLDLVKTSLPISVGHWLAALRPHWRSGNVLFVHAGVNPSLPLESFLAAPWNVPLARLDEEHHWAWVRWPFLDHQPGPGGWSGYFVLHGHTPNDGLRSPAHADQVRKFRLNLDAGSGGTGVAKMAILRGGEVEVVTVRGEPNARA
jgi:serine/threonine protein phosphatase 1